MAGKEYIQIEGRLFKFSLFCVFDGSTVELISKLLLRRSISSFFVWSMYYLTGEAGCFRERYRFSVGAKGFY